MTDFMSMPMPPQWQILSDPVSGQLDLVDDNGLHRGLTAMEVRRVIANYWTRNQEKKDEQHRSAAQAPRNSTPPQHPAGNSGGAPPNSGALAGQGTIAQLYANQRAGVGSLNPFAPAPPSAQMLAMQQMMARQQEMMRQAMLYGQMTPPTPKALPRMAPSVGELIGHRAWTVQGRNLLLSVSAKSAWFPGQAMHDKIGHGEEIDDHNTAGIWAFKDPYELTSEFNSLLRNGGVFGTVWLWGTVIEHERGYRAQYAAIRSLERAAPGIDIEILRAAYLRAAHAEGRAD